MTTQSSEIPEDRVQALTNTRRELHAHPELSGMEKQTAGKVAAYLERLGPRTLLRDVGGHGVVAIFDSGIEGPTVLFRAELDGLPITEKNTFAYKSKDEGISHKCGHDGHMTILLGLAEDLAGAPPERGRIVLLFQPSEENGAGAQRVLDDERFAQFKPDYVFALHNLPGYPAGSIVLREDVFTASVQSLIIRLDGAETHAAQPELGKNPALAIAQIIQQAESLSKNDPARADFTLITPVHIKMGKVAYGISAGHGELHFTLRTWTSEQMEALSETFVASVKNVAGAFDLDLAMEWTNVFYANRNGPYSLELIGNAAKALGCRTIVKDTPFKWGEDFGIFTQQFKGAMFGLGSGEDTPPLHHAEYDFPDGLIPVGVHMFRNIANQILS